MKLWVTGAVSGKRTSRNITRTMTFLGNQSSDPGNSYKNTECMSVTDT